MGNAEDRLQKHHNQRQYQEPPGAVVLYKLRLSGSRHVLSIFQKNQNGGLSLNQNPCSIILRSYIIPEVFHEFLCVPNALLEILSELANGDFTAEV